MCAKLSRLFLALLACAGISACSSPLPYLQSRQSFDTIAFGSCAFQGADQPIWNAVLGSYPDLFVFLGDNIYGDTQDMAELRAKYAQLAAKPGFARLRATVPVVATWDDHDYGANDTGATIP